MEIYKILLEILDKPNTPLFYRKLKIHYQNKGRLNETSALDYLIEKKFEKKDSSDNSNVSQE